MFTKVDMITQATSAVKTPEPDKENVSFTRYADEVRNAEFKERLQQPRGKPFEIIDVSKELFRVQKTSNHWDVVRRSKEFMAKDFFPPREIPYDTNLKEIFEDGSLSGQELVNKLLDAIPNVNHD